MLKTCFPRDSVCSLFVWLYYMSNEPNKCAAIALAKRPDVPGRETERNRKRETEFNVRNAVHRKAIEFG